MNKLSTGSSWMVNQSYTSEEWWKKADWTWIFMGISHPLSHFASPGRCFYF